MRPEIVCHMMNTADGRIFTNEWIEVMGEEVIFSAMTQYDALGVQLQPNGIILGRASAEELPLVTSQPACPRCCALGSAYRRDTGLPRNITVCAKYL